MQQIADWLEKLNLGQYAQQFAENDIDVSVLRHLTDADLEKIGVSLGHRRKCLAAIAELAGASPSRHEPAGCLASKIRPSATSHRCPRTSSVRPLSAHMDPEGLRGASTAAGAGSWASG